MKKKSTDNPTPLSPHNPVPPKCGDNNHIFIYWDELDRYNKEVEDIILFNSIQDTHRPDDEHILKVTQKK